MYPDQPLPPSPFTRTDAESHGISRGALRAMIRDGRVVRVLRGVYAAPGYVDSLEFRARAAKLVVNPNAVLCDRTAAWLHGVDVLTQPDKDVLPPLDTCTLRGTTGSQRPECRRKQRDLRPDDVMELHGLRVTTPLRTAADLGCCLSRRSALAALDGFMRVCRLSRADLEAQLPFYFRRRGVVQLRELVGMATPKAESPPESWMRLEILDAGLPSPSPQWWITIDGVPTFRLDLAYPMLKIVIEYDGREFHSEQGGSAEGQASPQVAHSARLDRDRDRQGLLHSGGRGCLDR